MSLSTLLEAAKYLDYLDSNNQQQQQLQLQFQSNQQQTSSKKSTGKRRISKKNAANTMVAMSLPTSTRPIQMHGVPIPVVSSHGGSGGESHQTASLSSSFTTGSPLSSFASTALFCSKASGVTSASSSAASSLSSSDSSSSCGEILMGDNDFNQSPATNSKKRSNNNNQIHNNNNNISSNNHHNYHLTNQPFETNTHHHQQQQQPQNLMNHGGNNHHIARYIAATSAGPQLVTMTTSSALASTSAPVDGSIRAGHVIHAATNHGALMNHSGTDFDSHRFSLATTSGIHHHHQALECHEGQTFSIGPGSSFGSDNHLSSSPGSCGPLIMTRVQPMILNSLAPASAQSIMAFQPATAVAASSPTSSSSSYSRHRELHKTLEKNRRAHLRHCFELLKAELPASECVDKKTSHINIIKSAIRYVLTLRQQECEIENELQRLTRIKTELTENLSKMRINEPMATTAAVATGIAMPPTSSASSPSSPQIDTKLNKQEQQSPQQLPAAEQQLSFLLSQSKID